MRQIVHTKGPLAAASANNIALAQQPTAAAGFTLNGALVVAGVAILDKARRILITTTQDDSAKTFTINGTDGQGRAISETMVGPNSTTGQTNLDFLTVTSITTNSNVTANLTVGTNGVASSIPLPLDHYGLGNDSVQVVVAGSVNYSVQYALDDPFTTAPSTPLNWFDFPDPNLVGQTISAFGGAQFLPAALRLLLTAGTGTATITILQPGHRE